MKPHTMKTRVRIDWSNRTLVIDAQYPYEIDFDRLSSTGQVLDFIFQIAGKPWADHALVGELVAALETIAERCCHNNAQGVWCPGGRAMRVNLEAGRFEFDKHRELEATP